jgi:hypothetical protein
MRTYGPPAAKLTEAEVREIRARYPDASIRVLADEYGMTYEAILNVVRNVSWFDADYEQQLRGSGDQP